MKINQKKEKKRQKQIHEIKKSDLIVFFSSYLKEIK